MTRRRDPVRRCTMVVLLLLGLWVSVVQAQVLDWARGVGGAFGDGAVSVAVDAAGHSYVTGSFEGVVTFGAGEPNETTLVSAGGSDIFVAKYDPNGTLVWVKRAGGTNRDEGKGIAVDAAGFVYVTGTFSLSAVFGPGEPNETMLTNTGTGLFVSQYAPDGNLVWVKGASGSTAGTELNVGGSGHIYVVGFYQGVVTFAPGEREETILDSGTMPAAFVAKYDDDGAFDWVADATASEGAFAFAVAVDEADNIFVTGAFVGTATFGAGEANETVLVAVGLDDIFVARYTKAGELLWVRQAGGPSEDDEADGGAGIVADGVDGVYVTGGFGETAVFGAGTPNEVALTSLAHDDAFLAKYNYSGDLVWVVQIGGPGFDGGNGVALGPDSEVYVSGLFGTSVTFDPGGPNETTVNGSAGDFFAAQYTTQGSFNWVTTATGPSSKRAEHIAADAWGGVYLVGSYQGDITFGAGEINETTLPVAGEGDLYIARFEDRSTLPEFSLAEEGVWYASTGFGDGGRLLTLDPATGAGTLVGNILDYRTNVDLTAVQGLAVNSKGSMFGMVGDPAGATLFRIDPATGLADKIGTITEYGFIEGIAFDEHDVLYGVTATDIIGGDLVTIDTLTADITVIGPTGIVDAAGLAFDPITRSLYASVGRRKDDIYRVHRNTGTATLVGPTGFATSTPDLLFDAYGNLYGAKPAGAGGGADGVPFDFIAIDKHTGTGTVVGPIGFTAVSGLATRLVWPPHDFLFLANQAIEISGLGLGDGDLHSNGDLRFKRGRSGTHTGNVSAVEDIRIRENNTIDGDVTAGEEVRNSGTVTGVITPNADVPVIPLPQLDFGAGGDDHTVPKNGSLVLPPGSYGVVRVRRDATLFLSAGAYFFESLLLDKRTVLSVDVENGAVELNVVNRLKFGSRSSVEITPSGETHSRLVSFNVLGERTVSLDNEALVLGTIIAPAARVNLARGMRFRGAICARKIEVGRESVFLHHNSALSLSKRAIAREAKSTRNPARPMAFELGQNHPNPFNPSTTITFALPEASEVTLQIYNLRGQLVRTLHSGALAAGRYSLVWNGADESGASVSSGVYIYRLRAGEFVATKTLTFIK